LPTKNVLPWWFPRSIALFSLISLACVVYLVWLWSSPSIHFNSDTLEKDNSVDYWIQNGNEFQSKGSYDLAIECYNKAITLKDNDFIAINNKGLAFERSGKYVEAIQAYDEAIRIMPHNEDAWNNKGNALVYLGQCEDAIECYDMAIKINPIVPQYYAQKGKALYLLGKYNQSLEAYDKAIEIDSKNAYAWTGKGNVLESLGRYNEANKIYNYSTKLNLSGITRNEPPSVRRLIAEMASPQMAGRTTIIFNALASDRENDAILYEFSLDNKKMTPWTSNSAWVWATSEKDIGPHIIKVKVMDNVHSSDVYDAVSITYSIAALANEPQLAEKPTAYQDNIEILSNYPQISYYPRINEYLEESLKPPCTPGSKQATCSSPDSCVDCNNKCWSPGIYDGGKVICSQGKWLIK
jgi:tetratricopeptide (TPR) repeat protein